MAEGESKSFHNTHFFAFSEVLWRKDSNALIIGDAIAVVAAGVVREANTIGN